MKKLFLISIIVAFCYCKSTNEVSVLNAGNLDSAKPYGLSSSEETILANRKNIDKIKNDLLYIKSKIKTLGDNTSFNKNNIDSYSDVMSNVSANINSLNQRVIILENQYKTLASTVALQSKDINDLKVSMNKMMDLLTNSYVTKDDLNSITDTLKASLASTNSTKISKGVKNKKYKSTKVSTSKANYNRAISYYRKKRYSKAVTYFELSIKKRYKIDSSYYYLGNISYYTKKYKKAIGYYKESIKKNPNSGFVPNTVYHTMLSFYALGDAKSGNTFKKLLLEKYPDSREARLIRARKPK